MMAITHNEVRRHPRWREEMKTPLGAPRVHRMSGAGLIGIVAFIIVTATAAILILNG
jgi:hypothetical protein